MYSNVYTVGGDLQLVDTAKYTSAHCTAIQHKSPVIWNHFYSDVAMKHHCEMTPLAQWENRCWKLQSACALNFMSCYNEESISYRSWVKLRQHVWPREPRQRRNWEEFVLKCVWKRWVKKYASLIRYEDDTNSLSIQLSSELWGWRICI